MMRLGLLLVALTAMTLACTGPATVALDELAFELPLAGGRSPRGTATVETVAGLLERHLSPDDPLAAYPERLADPALNRDLRGFLTGSIDCVVRLPPAGEEVSGDPGASAAARFLVVDYKTNVLGEPGAMTAYDYRPEALAAAMLAGHYPLQALLYAVALHRFLRWRVPDYRPDTHLGGIVYAFVRGMTGPDVPRIDGQPCGVFAWTPPAALVSELSDLLDGRATP
jgi:exodeoxyribonuclease V beta subunit